MITRSSHLDDADRWLLEHDPLLSRTTPKALASRRIRQRHAQGKEFFDESVEAATTLPTREKVNHDPEMDRIVRLAPPSIRRLVALRIEFPSASQAELARMLGCSRQAVSKKRSKLLKYLQAMALPSLRASPRASNSIRAMPVFLRPNGQLAWDFEEDK